MWFLSRLSKGVMHPVFLPHFLACHCGEAKYMYLTLDPIHPIPSQKKCRKQWKLNPLKISCYIVIYSPTSIITVVRTSMAALYCTTHMHIDTMPDICTLTSTFAWLRNSDNRGLTVNRCTYYGCTCVLYIVQSSVLIKEPKALARNSCTFTLDSIIEGTCMYTFDCYSL